MGMCCKTRTVWNIAFKVWAWGGGVTPRLSRGEKNRGGPTQAGETLVTSEACCLRRRERHCRGEGGGIKGLGLGAGKKGQIRSKG